MFGLCAAHDARHQKNHIKDARAKTEKGEQTINSLTKTAKKILQHLKKRISE
jgi:hypothetical protein